MDSGWVPCVELGRPMQQRTNLFVSLLPAGTCVPRTEGRGKNTLQPVALPPSSAQNATACSVLRKRPFAHRTEQANGDFMTTRWWTDLHH